MGNLPKRTPGASLRALKREAAANLSLEQHVTAEKLVAYDDASGFGYERRNASPDGYGSTR